MNDKIPKKRGRKPKKKEEDSNEPKIKKKRGRKPRSNITINNNPNFEGNQCDYIVKIEKKDINKYTNITEFNSQNNTSLLNNNNCSKKCWNCCNNFINNNIYSLPIKYIIKIFYTYGDFCSRECSARYCFDYFNNEKYEIYSLINLLYYIQTGNNESIRPSPNKLLLDIFGGNLTIDEYRSSFNSLHHYNIEIPPIIHLNHNFRITENKENNKSNNNYKLFRNNPINDSNNITNIMQLNIS